MKKTVVCPVCGEKIPESKTVKLPDGGYAFTCPVCGKDTVRPAIIGQGAKVCPVCGEKIPVSDRIPLPEGAFAITCPNCGKSATFFEEEPGVPHINN